MIEIEIRIGLESSRLKKISYNFLYRVDGMPWKQLIFTDEPCILNF